MFDWNNITITKIGLAIFVPPNTGTPIHNNRPYHGLVFNRKGKNAEYIFSNGFTLKVHENSLFYLPKGSSYKVITHTEGDGCFAINFDVLNNIDIEPFSVKIQNTEQIISNFKKSVDAFRKSSNHSNLTIMKNLYDIILLLKKEYEKGYTPNEKTALIKPALDMINANYYKNDLSVEELSGICGISVAYFRRIFTEKFGVSPKEYIINRRIAYAKKLLLSKQFSVSEVAEMCGYYEPCHFSREFSKRIGVSPNKYGRTVKLNES